MCCGRVNDSKKVVIRVNDSKKVVVRVDDSECVVVDWMTVNVLW